jgi:ribokinase
MPDRNIIVVGSANIDLVTRVPRSPKPGETLIGLSFMTAMGGKGANQAVAAARLGAHVSFAGCIGDDVFGGQQRQCLAADGIDLGYLKTHPSEPTGTAIILVADEGQNSIVVTPAANYGILPEDIAGMTALFEAADAVLLQLEIPLETVEAALDLARRCGTLSVIDAGPAQPLSPGLMAKADIVSPNETEAEALTGIRVDSVEDAERAAAKLLEMGVRHAVMKLGAHGSLYLGEDRVYVPAFEVSPVDTTAAGDAFTAALAVAWEERPIREALRFANAAGALAATVAGAQPSMPERAAVEAFLKNNPDVEG